MENMGNMGFTRVHQDPTPAIVASQAWQLTKPSRGGHADQLKTSADTGREVYAATAGQAPLLADQVRRLSSAASASVRERAEPAADGEIALSHQASNGTLDLACAHPGLDAPAPEDFPCSDGHPSEDLLA